MKYPPGFMLTVKFISIPSKHSSSSVIKINLTKTLETYENQRAIWFDYLTS